MTGVIKMAGPGAGKTVDELEARGPQYQGYNLPAFLGLHQRGCDPQGYLEPSRDCLNNGVWGPA